MRERVACCGEYYCRISCPISSSEPAPIIQHTQCCGSLVRVYTEYTEEFEPRATLVPFCSKCRMKVTLEGEKIE